MPVTSITNSASNCTDLIGWKDIYNNDCSWYKKYTQNCEEEYGKYYDSNAKKIGEIGVSYHGYVAFDACCKLFLR